MITTASNFTKGAVREASTRTATNEQYEMKLLSFPDIVWMLRLPSVEPYEPWKPFLDDGYVKVPREAAHASRPKAGQSRRL